MILRNFAFAGLAFVALMPAAFAQSVTLTAVMNGGNECDGLVPATCLKGDPDGSGIATITMPTATSICVSVLVNKLDTPSAAHIHTGTATKNGAPVVSLPFPATGNPGAASACVTTPAGFNNMLRNDPAKFYVNVHTGAFPGGAIRGQVF
jgi:CHRD domain